MSKIWKIALTGIFNNEEINRREKMLLLVGNYCIATEKFIPLIGGKVLFELSEKVFFLLLRRFFSH
jgi:hypothetical protein